MDVQQKEKAGEEISLGKKKVCFEYSLQVSPSSFQSLNTFET